MTGCPAFQSSNSCGPSGPPGGTRNECSCNIDGTACADTDPCSLLSPPISSPSAVPTPAPPNGTAAPSASLTTSSRPSSPSPSRSGAATTTTAATATSSGSGISNATLTSVLIGLTVFGVAVLLFFICILVCRRLGEVPRNFLTWWHSTFDVPDAPDPERARYGHVAVYSRAAFVAAAAASAGGRPAPSSAVYRSAAISAKLGGAAAASSSRDAALPECPVCWERPPNVVYNCGHEVCASCAHEPELMRLGARCPLCRALIATRVELRG